MTKIISVVSVALIVVAIGIYNIVLAPMMKYNKAVTLLESGSYDEAISSFTELGDYQDSANKIIECGKAKEYKSAEVLLDSGEYDSAVKAFQALGSYSDSEERIKECYYLKGINLTENESYVEAISSYEKSVGYKDTAEKLEKTKQLMYDSANKLYSDKSFEDAKELFTNLGDYKNSADMVKKCDSEKEKKVKANIIELGKNGKVEEAYQAYCSAYFSEGKTYFTKFASDNGFKDKLQPYIDDLKKYVGTYVFDKKSGLSDCIITVDTEKMIFYIKQSTLEYSWQIKPSTYKLETVRYEKDSILLCIDYVIDTSKGTVTYEYRTYDGELVEEHTANKQ